MLKRMLHSAQTVLTKPVTLTGTEIQAKETVNAKFDDFKMYGKTTQDEEPSPDNPIEIVNAGKYNEETGRYEIGLKVSGKNLCDLQIGKTVHLLNGVITILPSSGEAVAIINLTRDSTMTISVTKDSPHGVYFTERFNEQGRTHELYLKIMPGMKAKFNCYAGKNILRFIPNANGQNLVSFKPIKLQIEEGDTATAYEAYHAKEVTLTSPVPITKWDKLVKRDGVWGWSIWSKRYNNITDASVDGSRYRNGIRIYLYDITSYLRAECTCTIAASDLWFRIGKCGFWFNRIFTLGYDDEMLGVNAEDDIQTILQKFKDNILSKGISVVCQTQEEQSFHSLPDEEQILMNSLQSYYPTTIIRNTEDLEMEVTMKSLNILGGGYRLLRLLLIQRRWCYA